MPRTARYGVAAMAALCLLATGCGHMPATSLIKLARVDFETTDPAQLRAAVKLPRALRPLPHGVVLRIAVSVGGNPQETRDFLLRDLPEPSELATDAGADGHVFAYGLEDADIARLRAFRAELIARKTAGKGGAITISVKPDVCRATDLPEGPVVFTTYLKTAETAGYVTLARDVDLREIAAGRSIVEQMPRCAS